MTFKEYCNQAMDTAIYPNKGSNLVYPVLGLAEEIGELIELKCKILKHEEVDENRIKKEFGDIFWYIQAIIFEAGLDSEEVYEESQKEDSSRKVSYLDIFKLCGIAKKIMRDHEGVVGIEWREKIFDFVLRVLKFNMEHLKYDHGFDFEEILQLNIDKLQKRKQDGILKGSGDDR